MSDETTPQGGTISGETPAATPVMPAAPTAPAPADDFKPIASQEEVDRIVAARIQRERAKFADYDQLKQQAAELAKIQESRKTAEQKQAEAIARTQQDLESQRAANMRLQAALDAGVPKDYMRFVNGATVEELTASAQEAATMAAERAELESFRAAAAAAAQAPSPRPTAPAGGIPVANLAPGATPVPVTVAEDAYPANWIAKAEQ